MRCHFANLLARRADLLDRFGELSAKQGRALTVGLRNLRNLELLIDDMLQMARLDAGQGHAEHARFDFAKLVATTSEQMCLLAADKVREDFA